MMVLDLNGILDYLATSGYKCFHMSHIGHLIFTTEI